MGRMIQVQPKIDGAFVQWYRSRFQKDPADADSQVILLKECFQAAWNDGWEQCVDASQVYPD